MFYKLGVSGFNSYHGCIKCTVVGEWDKKGHHMSFPRLDCPKRTDNSFRSKADEDHHKEDTPLTRLPIDMVEDIIIADELHLFHLGDLFLFLLFVEIVFICSPIFFRSDSNSGLRHNFGFHTSTKAKIDR